MPTGQTASQHPGSSSFVVTKGGAGPGLLGLRNRLAITMGPPLATSTGHSESRRRPPCHLAPPRLLHPPRAPPLAAPGHSPSGCAPDNGESTARHPRSPDKRPYRANGRDGAMRHNEDCNLLKIRIFERAPPTVDSMRWRTRVRDSSRCKSIR